VRAVMGGEACHNGWMRSKPNAGVAIRPARRRGSDGPNDDRVAVEEPLEIRVAGDTVSVTMRTPGDDRELALGFLFAEGVIGSIDDVGSVAHCGRPGEESFGNAIEVLPAPGVVLAPERVVGARRGTLTTASCGVCGRASIDDLAARSAPLDDDTRLDGTLLTNLVASMRAEQRIFAETGGVHAAALFDASGSTPIVREDIGRHNAVDKVVGALLFARALPARGRVLAVSGRASFEIVQKAAAASIPIIASVSAASSLAIDLAARMNVTLASFVREETMTVYTHAERIINTAPR
jgi:FdhD protein